MKAPQTELRVWRLENKLTQEELAEQLGASRSSLVSWENNVRAPHLKMQRKIEALTGQNCSHLLPKTVVVGAVAAQTFFNTNEESD